MNSKKFYMEKIINLGVVYNIHRHYSLVSRFSITSSIYEFVTSGITIAKCGKIL